MKESGGFPEVIARECIIDELVIIHFARRTASSRRWAVWRCLGMTPSFSPTRIPAPCGFANPFTAVHFTTILSTPLVRALSPPRQAVVHSFVFLSVLRTHSTPAMPPRKRAKASAASTPLTETQPKTPQDTGPAAHSQDHSSPQNENIFSDPWTDDQETWLFKSMMKWKPTGTSCRDSI